MRGPFTRRKGHIDLTLTEPEVDLLHSVVRQMTDILASPGDMSYTTRLFPPAYPDDAKAQAEFASLTGDELIDAKRRSVAAVTESIERGAMRRGAWRLTLSSEEAEDWLAVLNDSRLTLGTRLGVTEEIYDRDVPPDHPEALAHEVFRYLGWLEEHLVSTLMG
jgi:hypothetical protein